MTIRERLKLILKTAISHCHVGLCIVAAAILFICFVVNHQSVVSAIMLYDLPIWGMSAYYCIGLNLLWYMAMLAWTKKIAVLTAMELVVLSIVSTLTIVFDVIVDLSEVQDPFVAPLTLLSDVFATAAIAVAIAAVMAIIAWILMRRLKNREGQRKNEES